MSAFVAYKIVGANKNHVAVGKTVDLSSAMQYNGVHAKTGKATEYVVLFDDTATHDNEKVVDKDTPE
jgi:hypothetical protein